MGQKKEKDPYPCSNPQSKIFIIGEFCDDGTLAVALKNGGKMKEKKAVQILYQLAKGL